MLHPNDVRERGYLCKMIYFINEVLPENLTILLDTEIDSNEGELVYFPCEEEIIEILTEVRNDVPTWLKSRFLPQQPVAVVWDCEGGNRFWCLGFFLDVVDEKNICVEHLKYKEEDQTMFMWINPNNDDIQIVKDCQVLPCDVDGYWDFSNPQCSIFIVNNVTNIEVAFKYILEKFTLFWNKQLYDLKIIVLPFINLK